MENNLEQTFLRLGYALRELKKYKNSTIILGAGCSLNSSSQDISTTGIMRDCLREHGVQEVDEYNWETLYKEFVNTVWQGKGEEEQKILLQNKLNDAEPSIGHKILRTLVEDGYIHNIITTNFDMLLEKTFDGLSYRRRVGIQEYQIVGNNPIVDIIKVHGDIENGGLCFAPNELKKLPDILQTDISTKTSGLLIVIGYRGQDIGLMNSLSKSRSFATYWIDINQPNISDVYATKSIYEFMRERNSENNFLYGNDLGDFHNIMQKLNQLLINPSHNIIIKSKEILLKNDWKNSTIVEMLRIYNRLYELFLDILKISEEITQKPISKFCSTEDCNAYNEWLHTYLYFFNSKKLPSKLLHIPNNEVDALLLGTAIEILVRTSNTGIDVDSFINELKGEVQKQYGVKLIDDTFWSAIKKIVCSNMDIDDYIEISLNDSLSLHSVKTPLGELDEILQTLQFLSLLLPISKTYIEKTNEFHKIRQLLSGKDENINLSNDKMILDLGIVNENVVDIFIRFCTQHLSDVSKECEINSNSQKRVFIFSKWINIIFEVSKDCFDKNNSLSLYAKIKDISSATTHSFLNLNSFFNMNPDKYVDLPIDRGIENFMISELSGIFIVGASGSGKTIALQKFVSVMNENIKTIVLSPKYMNIEKPSLSMFFDGVVADVTDELLLTQINIAFKERNEKLVLIFDGLNEINSNMNEQSIYYAFLLELVEKVHYNKLNNIKIIITCRERAYNQYRNLTTIQLNYLCFYTEESEQKKIENNDYSYHIPSLKTSEKKELLNKYIDESYKSKFTDQVSAFDNIFEISTTPFMVAAISTTINLCPNIDISNNYKIYSYFTNAMLEKLKESDRFLARKVIYTYFDLVTNYQLINSDVTKFKLLDNLPIEYHDKLDFITNKLIDINILLNDSSKKIKFQHDKIEEFFFKEYIEENSYKGMAFFDNVLELSYKNVIYQGGLLQYVLDLINNKKLKIFKDVLISLFKKNVDLIPKMTIEVLSQVENLKSVIEFILNINDFEDSIQILNLIIWGLDDCLQDYSVINFDFENIINELLEQSDNNRIIFLKQANLYYLKSKIFYFENEYERAQEFIERALDFVDESNTLLVSQIRVHRSVILMELGYSKKSIEELEKEYELFDGTNDEKSIFNVGIELGRALNHSAQIEQTLKLYDTLEKIEVKINNPYSLARFYEQKANTLNRIMYDKLEYGFVENKMLSNETTDEIDKLFEESILLYEKSMKILLDINALWSYTGVVPEKINTYISYSYSMYPKGIKECKELIDNVDNLFSKFTTPFKTDFLLAKAYYYEYIDDSNNAEIFIKEAINNAEILGIKNKQAKSHEFYAQFIYRILLKNSLSQNAKIKYINLGIEHINEAIDYYENFTLTKNNVALKNAYSLLKCLEKM